MTGDDESDRDFCVVVTGGRDYSNELRFNEQMDALHQKYGFDLLAHGNASGADSLADAWARKRNVALQIYEADWKTHGKAAGPIRNEKMLRITQPQLVIAFPGGAGTANCVKQARAMCFEIIECL